MPRNTLQLVAAPGLEDERAADHQAGGRARDQDLARPGACSDPRCDMDRHARDVLADQLTLAGVQPDADLYAHPGRRRDDRLCAAQRRRGRSREGRQEAISGRLHLSALKSGELPADELVVPGEEVSPAIVAQLRGTGRRVDYVGEHHGEKGPSRLAAAPPSRQKLLDLPEDRLGVAEEVERVPPLELHVTRSGDVLDQISGVADVQDQGLRPVHHERGHANLRQDMPCVEFAGFAPPSPGLARTCDGPGHS